MAAMNDRECYDSDQEMDNHVADYKIKRTAVEARIFELLNIDKRNGTVTITQSQSEIFTVVHIYGIKKREEIKRNDCYNTTHHN